MKKTFIAAALVALASIATMAQGNKFDYNVDSFADIQVLRYQVPGFADLSLNQKIFQRKCEGFASIKIAIG